MALASEVVTEAHTVLGTWFERDRAHVCLSWADADGDAGPTVVEWWDEAVAEAVKDGFLDRKDLHGSALAYARANGLLEVGASPVTVATSKIGFVASHPEKGVYLGWLVGGSPCWSSEATPERLAKGAYVFESPETLAEAFAEDRERLTDSLSESSSETVAAALSEAGLDQDPTAFEVPLGIPSFSNAWKSRVSLEECLDAGVPTTTSSPAP